jgi:parvulin-like peptidyl-prolyl isomerase
MIGKRLVAIFILCGGFWLSAACEKRGSALVKVGRESITEADLDLLTRVNPRLKPRLATPAGKQKILENYVDQELLYLESTSRGLHRTKNVKDKLQLYEKIIVAQALLDDELDRKVKEYFDNHRDEFERVKISHILIRSAAPEEKKEATKAAGKEKKEAKKPAKRTEAEGLKLAEQVRERLAKGEDFAKVAKEVSEDERSKNAGGDLGYITLRDKRLERWGWLPLAEKAFAMKGDEVSDVIKTKEGFHVVKVTEEKKLQPFEEAEAGIKFRLQADVRQQLLDGLKKKYKVEYAKAAGQPQPAPGGTPETAPTVPSEPGAPAPEGAAPPPAPQAAPEPPQGNP